MDATIWCTCPLCHGRRWTDAAEYVAEHQGVDVVRAHEVTIEASPEERAELLTFTGVEDEDGELQVLINVYPTEGFAEVSYRRHRSQTWGAPTICTTDDDSGSRFRHPSNVSRIR